MSQIFHFKEFSINQDKTAMKIGTDGILLGAWCGNNEYVDSILDIGSGTGVIALMLAQRFDALTIDAVELDTNAYEQSVENFENSAWADRLYCYHSSFQEFANEIAIEQETYDLVVSNPPFYKEDFVTQDEARNTARFANFLPFEDLLLGVSRILSRNGLFAIIIPFKEEEAFVRLANKYGLFLSRVCHVQGNKTSAIKRSLLQFSFNQTKVKREHLIIENSRHNYTEDYIKLTKDFYLKM